MGDRMARQRATHQYMDGDNTKFILKVDDVLVTKGIIANGRRLFRVKNPDTGELLDFPTMRDAKAWAVEYYDSRPGDRSIVPGYLR